MTQNRYSPPPGVVVMTETELTLLIFLATDSRLYFDTATGAGATPSLPMDVFEGIRSWIDKALDLSLLNESDKARIKATWGLRGEL